MPTIHPKDKKLVAAFFYMGIISLALGGVMALIISAIRTPALSMDADSLYYKALTAHAMLMFVHWLTFFQTALMIGAVTWLLNGNRLYSLKLGWIAFILMVGGFLLNLIGVAAGSAIMYTAFPPFSGTLQGTPMVYMGYNLLALGAIVICIDVLLTFGNLVEQRGKLASWKKMFKEIPISTFATVMGIVMVMPAAIVGLYVFIPAFMWSIDIGSMDPLVYRLQYHVLFHIIHYIPAMVLVGVCYVIVDVSMKAGSVFSKNVAKSLFILYPVTVPPTFLYHLLADPSIDQSIKSLGTALSLLVGVPTILHMFIIMGMMESKLRSAGHGGVVGWIRYLPWKNPAFVCMVMGMLSMGLGGMFAYVLIQEHAAPLLHGTFAVAAYIHPMASGGATLVFMGASYYMVAGLRQRQLWSPTLAILQSVIMTLGLFIFGIVGSLAGYVGVPRRTADVEFGGSSPELWEPLLNISLGLGAMLAVVGGALFILVIGMTFFKGKKVEVVEQAVVNGLDVATFPTKKLVKATPTSLVPGTLFIIMSMILTVIAYRMISEWPLGF
jgi:cytochrome c oxidase subunit 1